MGPVFQCMNHAAARLVAESAVCTKQMCWDSLGFIVIVVWGLHGLLRSHVCSAWGCEEMSHLVLIISSVTSKENSNRVEREVVEDRRRRTMVELGKACPRLK